MAIFVRTERPCESAAWGKITVKVAPSPEPAFDGQPGLMAGEDVLDDGKAEAGAAMLAAGSRRRPGRSARSAAAVLLGDARAEVADRDSGGPAVARRRRGVTTTRLPDWPYLQAFSIRFSKTWISSSRSPATIDRLVRQVGLDRDAEIAGERLERIGDMAEDRRRGRPGPTAGRCAFISIRDSDRRSSISRLMRVAWSCMMSGSGSRAVGVVAGRPLQRLDEAGERGERRAQLMAGIGDEIDADAVDAPLLGEVVEDERR